MTRELAIALIRRGCLLRVSRDGSAAAIVDPYAGGRAWQFVARHVVDELLNHPRDGERLKKQREEANADFYNLQVS